MEKNDDYLWTRGDVSILGPRHVTIDMLPDDVLLIIFAFYIGEINWIHAWHKLVHVCQKWRIVVFESPRRLDLRLRCGADTKPVHARKTLEIWPPLPIVISQCCYPSQDIGNMMAALEHNDRVCEFHLWGRPSSSQLEGVFAAMQKPFPALTSLVLSSEDGMAQVIPNTFLDGSAPSLRVLNLRDIAFPGLWKLLSSTTHLVRLTLSGIPRSDHISPAAMVTCLSALTKLETLCLQFFSPLTHPDGESRRPPPPTRSVLSSLTYFMFRGISKYLDDFVARIDAPMLDYLKIIFSLSISDTPNLSQFISRTPNLRPYDEACLVFSDQGITLKPEHSELPRARGFQVELDVPYSHQIWFSSFAQICRSSFPHTFIASLENLYIREGELTQAEDAEDGQWLELLHPFTAVKNLYLSKAMTLHIAPVLQELVGERVVQSLPALQGLFLEKVTAGLVQEAIEKFTAARQLFSRPIAVSNWVNKHGEW